ncbi:MAG: hypothetical protein AB1814_01195 [Thermodesulfobacteriota bacterium]
MEDRRITEPQISIPEPNVRPRTAARWPWLAAIVLLALVVAAAAWYFWPEISSRQAKKTTPAPAPQAQTAAPTPKAGAVPVPPPSASGKVVQIGPGTEATAKVQGTMPTPAQQAEQTQRKRPFGLQKSVDVVVRSDEAVQIGNRRITIDELERKLVVEQRGEMREKGLKSPKVTVWGVYLVRPGDNLWDVHYRLLKEYLASRGVQLPPRADQPTAKGQSSGVGKVLKFAEHMVGVYNVRTGHMTHNLNLLEPGQKAVVFNLSEIFAQLAKVDPKDLNGIMYDGRVLFFPKATPHPGLSKPQDKKG